MSSNVWNTLAGILWLVDFLGGLSLLIIGFVVTFDSPTRGWLEIGMGLYMLSHMYLIHHSRRDEG